MRYNLQMTAKGVIISIIMAAKMLSAYYGKDADAHYLFEKLKIAKDPS